MNTKLRYVLLASACVVAALTAACTRTVSRGVNSDGVPDEVVFPDLTESKEKQAIHPNPENLDRVKKGLSKRDMYYLLGAPHFSEMLGAREWDYVFKFDEQGETKYCQFKVVYDRHALASRFYWKPVGCMALARRR